MLVQRSLRNQSYPHPSDAPVADLPSGSIECLGGRMHYVRGSEIHGEEERAEYLYKVVNGAVRTYKMLVDGRRQVRDFHFPGDFFGLETNELHVSSAEAIVDST